MFTVSGAALFFQIDAQGGEITGSELASYSEAARIGEVLSGGAQAN
ncbi:hypothetical protein [uncultured Ruegeria sp.]|nr:hypothetical protein [uncultured Ruegeria sp.]